MAGFQFVPDLVVKRKVEIKIPTEGKATRSVETEAYFKILSRSKVENATADRVLLKESVTGWPDGAIQDASGNPLEFSADLFEQMLEVPYVLQGFAEAFGLAHLGKTAARGN